MSKTCNVCSTSAIASFLILLLVILPLQNQIAIEEIDFALRVVKNSLGTFKLHHIFLLGNSLNEIKNSWDDIVRPVDVFRQLWFTVLWSVIPSNCQVHRTNFRIKFDNLAIEWIDHRAFIEVLWQNATCFWSINLEFGALRWPNFVPFVTNSSRCELNIKAKARIWITLSL